MRTKFKFLLTACLVMPLAMTGCSMLKQLQAEMDKPWISSPSSSLKAALGTTEVVDDDDILVNWTITNTGRAMNYELPNFGTNTRAKTKAYDNLGNAYDVHIEFGGKQYYFNNSARAELPNGVPVKVQLRMNDVDVRATSFSRIIVSAWEQITLPTGDPGQFTLYNVPITR